MHSFEVSLGYESVDRTTFSTCGSASLKMYFGQCFHTPNETSNECIQFLNKTILKEIFRVSYCINNTLCIIGSLEFHRCKNSAA
jgi:hypothetical protein